MWLALLGFGVIVAALAIAFDLKSSKKAVGKRRQEIARMKPAEGQLILRGNGLPAGFVEQERKSPIVPIIGGGLISLIAFVIHPILGGIVAAIAAISVLGAIFECEKENEVLDEREGLLRRGYQDQLDLLTAPPSNIYGNARFAVESDIYRLELGGGVGIPLGELSLEGVGLDGFSFVQPQGPRLHYDGDQHGLLIGGTGLGKGSTMQIPTALEYPGSMFILDPKGQLAAVTARRRREMGQKVYCINPFRLHIDSSRHNWGLEKYDAGYNPLSYLDPKSFSFIDDLRTLADALIEHDNTGKHWEKSAKGLAAGIIGYECVIQEPSRRSLMSVRYLVAGMADELENEDQFVEERQEKIKDMFNDPHLEEYPNIRRLLKRFCQDNKEIGAILSTLDTQTLFLESEVISTSIETDSFRFSNMKHEPITVYVMLPLVYLKSQHEWLRILAMSAMRELMLEVGGAYKCLFMLDEFQSLGYLSTINDVLTGGRGYGIRLYPSINNISQLKNTYGKVWNDFMGNCGFTVLLRAGDLETAEHFSTLCGKRTVVIPKETRSVGQSTGGTKTEFEMNYSTGSSVARDEIERPLLTAKDLMCLEKDKALIFINESESSIKAVRTPYYDPQGAYVGMFDRDPYH